MEILTLRPSVTRPGMRATLIRAVTIVVAILAAASAKADNLEYAVKATFVPKFAPFVQWPPEALGPPEAPFVICTQGQDPVAAIIDRAASGQGAWGRRIIVRRLAAVGPQSGCHIAYIAGSPNQSIDQALAALRGAPVLTVTDNGAAKGGRGVIDFVLVAGRVGFDIDERAAAGCGLSISSKLLSLARSVNRR
jgi:hypothetical protein